MNLSIGLFTPTHIPFNLPIASCKGRSHSILIVHGNKEKCAQKAIYHGWNARILSSPCLLTSKNYGSTMTCIKSHSSSINAKGVCERSCTTTPNISRRKSDCVRTFYCECPLTTLFSTRSTLLHKNWNKAPDIRRLI